MTRVTRAFALIFLVGMIVQPAAARPPFLELFRGDPLRNQDWDGCVTCHVNPLGGGPRNDFGLAFGANQFTITPLLRSDFPDRFDFTIAEMATGGTMYFSGTADEGIVFEKDGPEISGQLTGYRREPTGRAPARSAATAADASDR